MKPEWRNSSAVALSGVSAIATVVLLMVTFSGFGPVYAGVLLILVLLISRRADWGLSLLLVTISGDVVRPLMSWLYVAFSELQAGAAVSAWAGQYFLRRRHSVWRFDWRPLTYGAPYLAAILVSGLVTEPWHKALLHTIRNSEPFWMCFLFANVISDRNERRTLSLAIAVAVLFYSVVGFARWTSSLTRIDSFFGNPNQFAGYLNLLLPFVLLFWRREMRSRIRWVWATLTVVCLLALVGTGSLSALAAALTIPITLWVGLRGPSPIIRTISFWRLGGALAFLAFLGVILGGYVKTIEPSFSPEAGMLERRLESLAISQQTRVALLSSGFRIWSEHPLFGVGPGNYPKAVEGRLKALDERRRLQLSRRLTKLVKNPENRRRILSESFEKYRRATRAHAHNLLMQTSVEFGLVGLLALLTTIGLVLRALWRLLPAYWAPAGLAMMVAAGLHNLFDVTYPSLGMEIGCLLGAALSGQGSSGGLNRTET